MRSMWDLRRSLSLGVVPLCGLAENEDHQFLYAAHADLGLGTCG